MVTSSNFHIEGSWIHIPPNGPTSETNAPRDHDQYHPVKQEENGGIQGKVRKHEKIYWKYTSCAQIHPYSSVFIQLAFQIAQPWVGPSQWLQAHPARKVAQWLCWVAFRNLCALVHVDMPGEHDFRDFKFVSLVGFFCIGQFIQRCRPQFVMLLCHKLWTGGKGSLQLLAPNWLFIPFSISKCRSLGQYCDGNYMKTAATTAWTSAREFSCLVCITSNHIGKMLGYFSTTRVGQCHLSTSLSMCCAMAAPKDAFRFLCQYEAIDKVQTTSEHCCCCRACNLKVWCNSALLCFSYAMESVEPKRNKRRVQLSSCIFCVALSLSLFLCPNSRKKNHIYPVISFMMISHDIIHDNKHQRFRL